MRTSKVITVFEHQSLRVGQHQYFDESVREALEKYYGNGDKPYFSLIHKGVKFNEYVGVLQMGNITIEILPKADRGNPDESMWRNMLIDMLWSVDMFEIQAPSVSQLQIKTNSILNLYFELFIKEIEYLLHRGLFKQYRKIEANLTSLKGRLLLSKHIRKNLVHKERFYVDQTTYDVEHKVHFILFKTIKLINKINTNVDLKSKIGSLLLLFPEMPDINVSESLFEKILLTRKNLHYEKAIGIAKLILLRYHPDVSTGKNNVLALMFDMNLLWEKFVYTSLKKHLGHDISVIQQSQKKFWKPIKSGYSSTIRPDILIRSIYGCVVLDTKWKNLNGHNPSPEDLKQMYVYHQYYEANKTALIYPGVESLSNGNYYQHEGENNLTSDMECAVLTLSVNPKVSEWQKSISSKVLAFMKSPIQ